MLALDSLQACPAESRFPSHRAPGPWRLPPAQRVWKIIIPAALPRIFVAFRLAAGIALIVAVTVEIAINPLGLGAGIMLAQQALRPDLMLAYLVWIGAIGYALNVLLVVAQKRLFGRAALSGDGR